MSRRPTLCPMCPTFWPSVKNSPQPAAMPKKAAASGRSRPSASQMPSSTVVATTSAMNTVRIGGTRTVWVSRHSSWIGASLTVGASTRVACPRVKPDLANLSPGRLELKSITSNPWIIDAVGTLSTNSRWSVMRPPAMCSSPAETPTCAGSPLTTNVHSTASSSGSPGRPRTLVMIACAGGSIGPGLARLERVSPLVACAPCAPSERPPAPATKASAAWVRKSRRGDDESMKRPT